MTYWNNIILPQLKDLTIHSIIAFDDSDVEKSFFIGDERVEIGEVKPEHINYVMLETKRTWIECVCIYGQIYKVTEENDRGEVRSVYSSNVKFNKDEDVYVCEEYGYRTWMWTPSTGIPNAKDMLDSYMDKAPDYFLIGDPRAIDPKGKWYPITLEFGEDDCEMWETYHGILVEGVPSSRTGEYFLHVHEREDTYFCKRDPLTEEEIEERKKMVESFLGRMKL